MEYAEANNIIVPPNALVVPRFCSSTTFARLPQPRDVKDYDVAVLGVPFDSAVSFRPGARFGPSAIRTASRLLRPYHPGLDVWPFHQQQCVDAGDVACNPFNIQEAIKSVEEAADELLTNKKRKLMTIGGDHTVALPLLRSINKVHGPVSLIHFDAHLDTWDTYFGEPYTHGTPFRRAAEEKLFIEDSSMHVGIRGPIYSPQDFTEDKELGFKIIHAMELETAGIAGVVKRIKDRVGTNPLYISIDIDVCDPSHCPGTGTPEIGGLTTREMQGILRGLEGLNVVSADVVEVAPSYDHAEITSMAAAGLCYELMGLMAKGPTKQ